jgi:hypothetical protein
MLKHNQYCNLLQCRIYRLLFFLFLALFTLYPILDAYADSFNYSPANFDMADDSFYSSEQITRGHPTSKTPFNGLFLPVSARGGLSFSITNREYPAIVINNTISCSPLSSDPSPPVA